jgi:hypothetical protein
MACSTVYETYTVLPEAIRRTRSGTWKDDIKRDLTGTVREDVNWIHPIRGGGGGSNGARSWEQGKKLVVSTKVLK